MKRIYKPLSDEQRARRKLWLREWRKANPEKVKAYDAKRYAANSEQIKKNSRKWREQNPERKKETAAKWYVANRDKCCANARNWAAVNRKRRNQTRRLYQLTDSCIIKQFCKNSHSLTIDQIPQSLIEAKRAHLRFIRLIKSIQENRV